MKPWPAEAVIVVAPLAGCEIRADMEGVYEARCRDCRAEVHADTYTVRVARGLPGRRSRPVQFLCQFCVYDYNAHDITELHDHRKSKP